MRPDFASRGRAGVIVHRLDAELFARGEGIMGATHSEDVLGVGAEVRNEAFHPVEVGVFAVAGSRLSFIFPFQQSKANSEVAPVYTRLRLRDAIQQLRRCVSGSTVT